ncbi:hypothetical protein DFH11DRAFT_1626118, partial [Phellopilus nigrolimitatus]
MSWSAEGGERGERRFLGLSCALSRAGVIHAAVAHFPQELRLSSLSLEGRLRAAALSHRHAARTHISAERFAGDISALFGADARALQLGLHRISAPELHAVCAKCLEHGQAHIQEAASVSSPTLSCRSLDWDLEMNQPQCWRRFSSRHVTPRKIGINEKSLYAGVLMYQS